MCQFAHGSMFTCTGVSVCTWEHVHVYRCVDLHMRARSHVQVSVCTWEHIHVYTCVSLHMGAGMSSGFILGNSTGSRLLLLW